MPPAELLETAAPPPADELLLDTAELLLEATELLELAAVEAALELFDVTLPDPTNPLPLVAVLLPPVPPVGNGSGSTLLTQAASATEANSTSCVLPTLP